MTCGFISFQCCEFWFPDPDPRGPDVVAAPYQRPPRSQELRPTSSWIYFLTSGTPVASNCLLRSPSSRKASISCRNAAPHKRRLFDANPRGGLQKDSVFSSRFPARVFFVLHSNLLHIHEKTVHLHGQLHSSLPLTGFKLISQSFTVTATFCLTPLVNTVRFWWSGNDKTQTSKAIWGRIQCM